MEVGQEDDERGHAREEQRVRRFGTICLIAGILIVPLTFMACLALEVADVTLGAPGGWVFTLLGILTLALLGTALIILGGMERLHRPVRARQRHTATAIDLFREEYEVATDVLRDEVAALTAGLDDRFNMWLNLAAPVPGRLVEVQKELVEIKTVIVEHLPDVLQRENWRGFEAAIREGFAQQTGTDGSPRRRPQHLGLVPDDDAGQSS